MGTEDTTRVAVVHPGTQHSLQTALAFQEAGVLVWYATAMYGGERHFPRSWARWLPKGLRSRLEVECGKRCLAELDEGLVITRPGLECAVVAAQRLGPCRRWAPGLIRRRDRVFGAWAGSKAAQEADVLVAFGTSGGQAFARAKPAGVRCVLDHPTLHWSFMVRAMREEARKHPDFGADALTRRANEMEMSGPARDAALALADQVLVGSTHAGETLVEAGLDRGKVSVVPYGADPPASPGKGRLDGGPTCILYVGSISAAKGMWYLLEAVREVRTRQEVELVLVGHLELPRGCLSPYESFVTHVPHVPREQLWGIYSSSDVFAFPSLFEGFGMAALEAAAMGLPVVATSATGVADILAEGEGGAVVPPADHTALAATIAEVASCLPLRHRLGDAARKAARAFTWTRYRRRVVEAVLGARGADGPDES